MVGSLILSNSGFILEFPLKWFAKFFLKLTLLFNSILLIQSESLSKYPSINFLTICSFDSFISSFWEISLGSFGSLILERSLNTLSVLGMLNLLKIDTLVLSLELFWVCITDLLVCGIFSLSTAFLLLLNSFLFNLRLGNLFKSYRYFWFRNKNRLKYHIFLLTKEIGVAWISDRWKLRWNFRFS